LTEYFLVLSDDSPLAVDVPAPGCPPRSTADRKRQNDGSPIGSQPPRRANVTPMETDIIEDIE